MPAHKKSAVREFISKVSPRPIFLGCKQLPRRVTPQQVHSQHALLAGDVIEALPPTCAGCARYWTSITNTSPTGDWILLFRPAGRRRIDEVVKLMISTIA